MLTARNPLCHIVITHGLQIQEENLKFDSKVGSYYLACDNLNCRRRFFKGREWYSLIRFFFQCLSSGKRKYSRSVLPQRGWYSYSWNQQSQIFEMPLLLYSKNITEGRRTKHCGNVTISSTCPSNIPVVYSHDQVSVLVVKTHSGHFCNAGYILLLFNEKERFACEYFTKLVV